MNTMAWGAEEQRLLEQALKTYPVSTQDRWDRIAECVPSRTKKDCMRRYKVGGIINVLLYIPSQIFLSHIFFGSSSEEQSYPRSQSRIMRDSVN